MHLEPELVAQASEHREVTDQRRELILQALVAVAGTTGGASAREVTNCLIEWIKSGVIGWPKATWRHATSWPYQGGTHQHLAAMRRRGLVELTPAGWRPKTAGNRLRVRHRALDALRLKSEGKTADEIAEELELSRSLVYSLLNDPTGEKERDRKRNYCGSCGAKKPAGATVCLACQDRKAEELLPPATFLCYIERAREAGYELLFGVTPDFRRVLRVGVDRGFFEHEVRPDLSWLDALHELSEELGVPLAD